VGLSRTASYSHFLQQLSKAASAVWDKVSRQCLPLFRGRYRYVLPVLASASLQAHVCVPFAVALDLLCITRCWLRGWQDAACGSE
jgi:hypothetical protein